MKAVMYHYVREYDPALPYLRFLDIKNFRQQLDYFEREFGFVSFSEWSKFISDGVMPIKAGKVLLTFDDITFCHYEYVLPELLKRNLWGIFYAPTQPYLEHSMLDVHKIHVLSGAIDGVALLNETLSFIDEEMIPDSKIREFRTKTYIFQEEYEGVSEFKRILNYFIDYNYRSDILGKLASKFSIKFDFEKFYVQESDLTKFQLNGMVIGSHTNSHPVMSKLSEKAQSLELSSSFTYLEQLELPGHRTYCHPYGGFHSFNEATLRLLSDEKVDYSFNVEEREINSNDRMNSIQHLPRFDCNMFPYGEAFRVS